LNYKCPLCLTPLTSEISLERYCVKHPRSRKVFTCGARTLRLEIYCAERGDNCNETTEDGVFFRHIECSYKNPFWKEEKGAVEVPVEPEATSAVFHLDFGRGLDETVRVQHWLLGVLNLLPKDVPEMWFPAMLLRATAETNSLWQRVGVLVELAGAQECGKTVLAMMSMNSRGYALHNGSSLEVELRDFIYSSHTTQGQLNRYIETLHLSTLLRDSQPRGLFLPQGTVKGRSIKVSFIKPSRHWQVPADDDVSEDLSLPKRLALNTLFAIPHLVKGFVSQTALVFWQITHKATHYPFWYTVVLYDTAGEANDARDLQRELQAIDKVAVVINAGEIFGLSQGEADDGTTDQLGEETKDQSLRTACERIKSGVDRKQKLYLVITQMDRIREQIKDDWQQVETIADSIGSKKYNREAKDLLKKWLTQSQSTHAADLRNKLRNVISVFFLWTENLPPSQAPANQKELPRSKGLAKFMCDCLGIKPDQIIR
jgi:hypothetical protein